MNKDLLNQLPSDEQPVAAKLHSVAEDMKLAPGFQWKLENELMDAYKAKAQPAPHRSGLLRALGWAMLAATAIFLLNWTMRTRVSETPLAEAETAIPGVPFESSVRQGDICPGSLALAHGFNVFLANEDRTGFVPVDTGSSLDELRSFAWSADGERLALVGNTTGSGAIYVTGPGGGGNGTLISAAEAGYLRDAAWSRDGTQFVLWSSQHITALYLLPADGTGPVATQLEVQILGAPQFAPDGDSVVFYGADTAAAGLFELNLDSTQLTLIHPFVEDESGFAFSPDGSVLAYIEYDRDAGEARLVSQELTTGQRTVVGTLPIPAGSGASTPRAANLSWSPDGTFLVFDLGHFPSERALYRAAINDSRALQTIGPGYAPAISSDGRCLAYISNNQVFLLDLMATSPTAGSVLLSDLPAGRGMPDLDKLQWSPAP